MTALCTLGGCGPATLDLFDTGTNTSDVTTTDDPTAASADTASCGDGVVGAGEACDDANDDETDACLSTCVAASCGDGRLHEGVEECDDANNVDGDGCTAACVVQVCGDGVVQAGETCDDANQSNDDACTVTCLETGCGDGFLQEGEACDDGDTIDNACSSTCRVQEVLEVVPGMCARLTGGIVKCWGRNNVGQLGLGDTDDRGDEPGEMGAALPPVDLGAGQIAVALSAGSFHTCALLAGGQIKCWGSGGVLGLGDAEDRGDQPGEMGDNLPFVDLGAGFVAIALATGGHSCALNDGGRVKCWGSNNAGQLGLGDEESRGDEPGEMGDNLPFVDLGVDVKVVALVAGGAYTCALLTGGGVKCWGSNNGGRLGLGDEEGRGDEPGEMGDALPLVNVGFSTAALTAGTGHTCAIDGLGRIKCWGANSRGELGLGDSNHRGDQAGEMGQALPLVDLGAEQFATAVHATSSHTCALVNDGVKCWGWNLEGQLGLGDGKHRGNQPGEMGDVLPTVDLGIGVSIASFGGGGPSGPSCALLTDSSVKCWGANYTGELGQGDTEARGDQPGEMGDALPRIKLFSNNW